MTDFEEIYTQFSPKIFRVCMGYVNDYEQARDLTQETFIAVWQNLSSFKNESKISTWIFRNLCKDAQKYYQKLRKTIKLTTVFPGGFKKMRSQFSKFKKLI